MVRRRGCFDLLATTCETADVLLFATVPEDEVMMRGHVRPTSARSHSGKSAFRNLTLLCPSFALALSPEQDPLSALSIEAVKDRARAEDIDISGLKKKDELVAALRAHYGGMSPVKLAKADPLESLTAADLKAVRLLFLLLLS